MALLVIPVCHNLQDRLSAIEEFSQMLQNLTENQCQSELGRVIITTIVNIAKKEIDLIPDTTTEDIIRTFFVFFLSLEGIIRKTRTPIAVEHSGLRPLLEQIRTRLLTIPPTTIRPSA